MNAPVTNNSDIDALRQALVESERVREQQRLLLLGKERIIDKLEQQLAMLAQRHWGVSSEKHPGQGVLSLFNEAELAAMDDEGGDEDEPETDAEEPANKSDTQPKAKRRRRVLPDHLERVRVTHELDEAQRHSACGQTLVVIGEEITEQLGVLPAQQFVIQHVKIKYACPCKACGVKTAPMPPQPLPGSQASALLLAHTMVSKFHDGLPLYRQERMAARLGLDLPRSKLARWLIDGSALLQPLYNLMQDIFFSYDIAMSDDTGIQVLKEDGRSPHSRSALWIRRGGAPETPVVLVDYNRSKGAKAISPLLDQFHGYLVCDAAPTFNAIVAKNDLKLVLCNDHARRKFTDVLKSTGNKPGTQGWVVSKAIKFYKRLYKIEKQLGEADATAAERYARRQTEAIPIWDEFLGWAKEVQALGVRDGPTRAALQYLITHEQGLQRYCEDGRLPISNILSEHVAKTVAVARKNFLFADTPAGAGASALVYSILESARANGHNTLHYMTAVIDAMPAAETAEAIEALLPWTLTPEEAARRYAQQPSPLNKKVA